MSSEANPWTGRLRERRGQPTPSLPRKTAIPSSKKRKLDAARTGLRIRQTDSASAPVDPVVEDGKSQVVDSATQTTEAAIVSRKRKHDGSDGPGSLPDEPFDDVQGADSDEQEKPFIRLDTIIERLHEDHKCTSSTCDVDFECKKRNCVIRVVEVVEKYDRIVEQPTHFLVDRKAIASASRFFEVMLLSNAWGDTGKDSVELHEIDAAVLRAILCIAAGAFNSVSVSAPKIHSSLLLKQYLKAIDIPVDDAISTLIKAQAFLLDRTATQSWFDKWINKSSRGTTLTKLEIGIAYAYQNHLPRLFVLAVGQYVVYSPLAEPIRPTLPSRNIEFSAIPACIFEKLEKLRKSAVEPFVRNIDAHLGAPEAPPQSLLGPLLSTLGLQFDGQRLSIPINLHSYWKLRWIMRVNGIDKLHREWCSKFSKFLSSLIIDLSSFCLDCLSGSIKRADSDDPAWIEWARRPMEENCHQLHQEQGFRNSFVGASLGATRVLQLRNYKQGCSWYAESCRAEVRLIKNKDNERNQRTEFWRTFHLDSLLEYPLLTL